MATLSLMVHHEVQNYEDHKVSFKKDPKPYVYQEMTTTSSTIYVTVYQKISANTWPEIEDNMAPKHAHS